MGRRSKADLRANRDSLEAKAEKAAGELRTLADAIEALIPKLPLWTKREVIADLQRQADRAQAIATALAIEARGAHPKVTGPLLNARTGVAVVVLSILSQVSTGALEAAGAEIYRHARDHAAEIAEDEDQPRKNPSPRDPVQVGAAIKDSRISRGMTQHELARVLGVGTNAVSTWERGTRTPSRRNWRGLIDYFNSEVSRSMSDDRREELEKSILYLEDAYTHAE